MSSSFGIFNNKQETQQHKNINTLVNHNNNNIPSNNNNEDDDDRTRTNGEGGDITNIQSAASSLRDPSSSLRDPAISAVIYEYLKHNDITSRVISPPLQHCIIKNILLVSSAYDLFIFEEGGGFSDALYSEYQLLKLRQSPQVTRVSSPSEALVLIENTKHDNHLRKFDLVICFLRRAEGVNVWTFLEEVKRHAKGLPVTLLASNEHELNSLDPRVDTSCRFNATSSIQRVSHPPPPPPFSSPLSSSSSIPSSIPSSIATTTISSPSTPSPSTQATTTEQTTAVKVWSWPFLWQGDMGLILALIKIVEDRLNLQDVSSQSVKAILLVEDNVQFYSAYLPILYKLIYQLTHHVLKASSSHRKRLEDRLKRPKILLANSFEEALDLFDANSSNILGIITDVGYPRAGKHNETAGLDFVRNVQEKRPNIPVLVQSVDPLNESKAISLGASFLLKSDPQLLNNLKNFMESSLGFGPFLFRLGHGERIVFRAMNLVEFGNGIQKVPEECIAYHLLHGHFQTWFAAHAWFELAEEVTKVPSSPAEYRSWMLSKLSNYLCKQNMGSVVEFDLPAFSYEPSALHFSRLGSGSMGGKGHALAYIYSILQTYDISHVFPEIEISLPRSLVIATGVFTQYMQTEGLYKIALDPSIVDSDVCSRFTQAHLPSDVQQALRLFISKSNFPLAVRSSSVFEDAIDKPYAGVFDTFLLPNNDISAEVRVEQLQRAIKLVYASAYKLEAQAYMQASGARPEQVQMAVIIQQLVGNRHGDFFFPEMTGVAGSYDVYAQGNLSPSSGFCEIALGLGGTVVGGEYCVRFSPGDPKTTLQTAPQPHYLALPLSSSPSSSSSPLHLDLDGSGRVDSGGRNVYSDVVLNSSDDISSFPRSSFQTTVLRQTKEEKEMKVTIQQMIKEEMIPLSQLVTLLLKIGSSAMSCHVEMEFSVDISDSDSSLDQSSSSFSLSNNNNNNTNNNNNNTNNNNNKKKVRFSLLQMRAMPQAVHLHPTATFPPITVNESNRHNTIAFSPQSLGHGVVRQVWDIIWVCKFGRYTTREIATHVGILTQQLHDTHRPYILIGPGRWGTHNESLGIPVSWKQIRGAVCIVETPLANHTSASLPSQGSHFFRNLTSFSVMYFTIADANAAVNRSWLLDQVYHSNDHGCVRHIPTDAAIEIISDGNTRCGVIMLPGLSHETLAPPPSSPSPSTPPPPPLSSSSSISSPSPSPFSSSSSSLE